MEWTLLVLVLVSVLGWLVLVKPLRQKVWALQKVIELDSAQKMERILALESRSRSNHQRIAELESELKWKAAKVLALESDLERAQAKLMWKE